MITGYEIISSRCSSYFFNACFFHLLSTIKVKLVDEMTLSAYLCVILHVKHKKYHLSRFWPGFYFFFVKSKMATIVGDVTGLQQRHHPIKYILSCREDQRLSIEGKIISKYCNILKTLGRVSINPRPSLYHGGGMNLRLRPRVNSARKCFYDDRKTIAGYVCMGYIGL